MKLCGLAMNVRKTCKVCGTDIRGTPHHTLCKKHWEKVNGKYKKIKRKNPKDIYKQAKK